MDEKSRNLAISVLWRNFVWILFLLILIWSSKLGNFESCSTSFELKGRPAIFHQPGEEIRLARNSCQKQFPPDFWEIWIFLWHNIYYLKSCYTMYNIVRCLSPKSNFLIRRFRKSTRRYVLSSNSGKKKAEKEDQHYEIDWLQKHAFAFGWLMCNFTFWLYWVQCTLHRCAVFRAPTLWSLLNALQWFLHPCLSMMWSHG